MTFDNMTKGLTILMKYDPKGSMCAEHDQIFFLPPDEARGITDADKTTLEYLGFHYSDSDGWFCFT